MNNWKFDRKSAAIGGIATSIVQTVLLIIAITIMEETTNE